MLILRATGDLLRVITTVGGSQIEAHVSYVDILDSAAPPVVQFVDVVNTANISSTTTTTILDCTTANHARRVLYASLHNNHGSVTEVVEVIHSDGSTVRALIHATLLAGETLAYNGVGTWLHYDTNGALYPSVGNAATQAEMEGGTATNKYVTPQGMNWHPGVAKAWGKHIVSGTVPQMTVTWNVTSVTDSGVSRVTPVIATDFSSTNYVVTAAAEAATTSYSATTTCLIAVIRNATQTVTQFTIDLLEIDIGQTTDPAAWHWAVWGDQ
jgi:hypothetical protein